MTIRYAAYAASPKGGFDLFTVDKTPGTPSKIGAKFGHVWTQKDADRITTNINIERTPLAWGEQE